MAERYEDVVWETEQGLRDAEDDIQGYQEERLESILDDCRTTYRKFFQHVRNTWDDLFKLKSNSMIGQQERRWRNEKCEKALGILGNVDVATLIGSYIYDINDFRRFTRVIKATSDWPCVQVRMSYVMNFPLSPEASFYLLEEYCRVSHYFIREKAMFTAPDDPFGWRTISGYNIILKNLNRHGEKWLDEYKKEPFVLSPDSEREWQIENGEAEVYEYSSQCSINWEARNKHPAVSMIITLRKSLGIL